MKRLHTVGVLLAVCAATVLAGCSSTPSGQRRDRLGVQVATMALIERADNPADKAAQVIATVDKARTLLELTDVSVHGLRAALLERVAERFESGKLSPLERLAALELVNTIADEVEARLGAGTLPPDARVRINTVLTWVEDAARTYVPQPSHS